MGTVESSDGRQRRRCASVFSDSDDDDTKAATSGTPVTGAVNSNAATTSGSSVTSNGKLNKNGTSATPMASARQLPLTAAKSVSSAASSSAGAGGVTIRSNSAMIHAEEEAIELEIQSMKLTSAQPLIRAADTVAIGKGSFGQVFKVRLPSGRMVAVKVVRSDSAAEVATTPSTTLPPSAAHTRRNSATLTVASVSPSNANRPRTPELPAFSPVRPSITAPPPPEVFETDIHDHPLNLWTAAVSLDTIEEGPESPDPSSAEHDHKDQPTSEVCFCGKVCTTGYRCSIDGFFMCTTCGKTLGKALHKPVPRSYTAMFRTSTISVASNVLFSSPTTTFGSDGVRSVSNTATSRIAEIKQNQWHARLARAEEVAKSLRDRDHSSRHFVRVFANLPANPLPSDITPAQSLDVPRALIMEYCQGSLSELILDRITIGYTIAETLLIVDQVLRALIQMHAGGDPILHLELNPKNVLYHILGPEDDEHGFVVKLTDFGIHTTTSITSVTTHPRLKVEDHSPAGVDCDIWSVAVLLWCLRTGHVHGTEEEVRTWMNVASQRGDAIAIIVKQVIDKIAPVVPLPSSSSSTNATTIAATSTPPAAAAAGAAGVRPIPLIAAEPVTNWGAADMLSLVAAAMPAALKSDLPLLQEHALDSEISSPMRRGLVAELLRAKSIRGL